MIIIMMFFAIFITPQERANAAGPIALGLGTVGIYVVGALGVAAIAGIIELDSCPSCQEDIEAHALRTWDGATQLAKDGMQAMVDGAIGLGNVLTATDQKFNTWMDSQIRSLSYDATNIAYDNVISQSLLVTHQDKSSLGATVINVKDSTGETFCRNPSGNALCTTTELRIESFSDGSLIFTTPFLSSNFAPAKIGIPYATLKARVLTIGSLAGFNAFASEMYKKAGIAFVPVTVAKFANVYADGVSRTSEAWQDMKDAGLVLPVDNARPYANGQPLTYDPATDTYAGIDGVAVPHGDITMELPKPHWKTNDDLVALGIAGAGAGLYIDGWADTTTSTSTYNPTTDTTTTVTSGTTTGVTTGTTHTTTTTTTTTGDTTGDTTTNPPADGGTTTPKTPKDKANRWGKLITTKFPFSLPWDLFFVLSFMKAEPKTPVFKIDERINKRANTEGIAIKFEVNLSFLDPYIPWFRRFLILGFAFFLIMNTRKLLGGAQ